MTPGFTGDAQAIANAIAERLIITPSEPWSSFVQGAAQPASNVGPWLADGEEWRVWDDGLGTYRPITVDGTRIKEHTISPAALQLGAIFNSALVYDGAGGLTSVAGTPGQVLTVDSTGAVAFKDPVSKAYFEAALSADQTYAASGAILKVNFNTVLRESGVVFDTSNLRVPVTAGSVWHFYAYLQIENVAGPVTDVQHVLLVRPNGATTIAVGANANFNAVKSRSSIGTSGVYKFTEDGWADVTIMSLCAEGTGNYFAVAANSSNTRFGGFRLF